MDFYNARDRYGGDADMEDHKISLGYRAGPSAGLTGAVHGGYGRGYDGYDDSADDSQDRRNTKFQGEGSGRDCGDGYMQPQYDNQQYMDQDPEEQYYRQLKQEQQYHYHQQQQREQQQQLDSQGQQDRQDQQDSQEPLAGQGRGVGRRGRADDQGQGDAGGGDSDEELLSRLFTYNLRFWRIAEGDKRVKELTREVEIELKVCCLYVLGMAWGQQFGQPETPSNSSI
jgi:hypothetical protein